MTTLYYLDDKAQIVSFVNPLENFLAKKTPTLTDHMTLSNNEIQSSKPLSVVLPENATQGDGINLTTSNSDNWQLHIDTNNDLTFSYNDTIVHRLSHN